MTCPTVDPGGRCLGLRLRRPSPSPAAGLLVARLGGGRQPLVGPIVVTGRRDTTAISLTTAQIHAVLAALTSCR
ncbi:hypothetical protein GKC29_14870 [Micromonospora sp. WMMC415]|uniref:hypothetical protein n=1 Tax=Micromonospora sp. WMMC415 TaxID=2675222 RepID=UPI0012B4DA52|nr:hypothetical protein [Micromonospora sp. WMMC415]QGN48000.1 hypothetical protein GKC29_14870 [Micromonospora sp. WMMC415]